MSDYNEEFYQHQEQGSLNSARVIVPLVLELLRPRSVIDVGCGVGAWLAIYREHGVEQILGVDGEHVDRGRLHIDPGHFLARDLTRPLDLGRRFDLVQSLEVAEHLEERYAEGFVETLVHLGEAILFSAAVPFQLGTHHVNEQFLDYWVSLFRRHNYHPVDCIRPMVWANDSVEVCYRQNAIVFAHLDLITSRPELEQAYEDTDPYQLSIIHPDLYSPRISRLLTTLLESARQFHRSGNLQMAEQLYRSILMFNPRDAAVWHAHGQLALQAQDYPVAVNSITKAIEQDSQEPEYHFTLGQVHISLREPDQARAAFHQALELDAGFAPARDALDSLDS